MYQNHLQGTGQHEEPAIDYQKYLSIGNYLLIMALSVMFVCLCIGFIFDQYISLPGQVLAHIGTLIFAGIAKVSYIIRCVGAKGLGHRNF